MRIRDRSLARGARPRDHGAVDLDPAHLRSFLAIVRYGGYHRAADALHLTQPAVSRHIRRLEEQLGEPLFARRGRGVELTDYGERAAAELAAVVNAHDRALVRLQRDSPALAEIFECRYFAALGEEETARALGCSLRTVQRGWMRARAWLRAELVEAGGRGELER